ncbi:cytochrome c oxidase subunit 7B, mitochondrial [Eleutherodactylus coqui]|uniref:cytochrome c oxidase subunit 7B, mitochondrial n=1 Tax=Eleutherodactylus coqui TaxID=57060 RepID=UPI00346333B7
MFPLARSALTLAARGLQRPVVRQTHHGASPDFHDKYGNLILASGTVFCVAVWGYVITQAGICWNLSPVGRVTPKEWRDQ